MRILIYLLFSLFSIPTFAAYCPSSGSFSSFQYLTNVQIGFGSHTSNNDGGYGNHTDHTFYLDQSLPLPLSLTASGGSNYVYRIWLDLDQSNSFEEDELIHSIGESGVVLGAASHFEDQIIIPASAEPGYTRLRVQMFQRLGSNYDLISPCANASYGEVEDYTAYIYGYCVSEGISFGIDSYYYINSVRLDNGHTITTGNDGGYGDYTSHSVTARRGENLAVTLDGSFWDIYSSGAGRQWRIMADLNADGDFGDAGEVKTLTNITDSSTTFSIPNTAAIGLTRMRIQFGQYTDGTGCIDGFHGETEDYTLIIAEPSTYCKAYSTDTHSQRISEITLGDITYELGYSGGYQDIGDELPLTFAPGEVVDFAFQKAVAFPYAAVMTDHWQLQIDWNNNSSFGDLNETVSFGFNRSGSFTIPAGTTPGTKKARVIFQANAGLGVDFVSGCWNPDEGDVLDFNFGVGALDFATYCPATSQYHQYEFMQDLTVGDNFLFPCGCAGYEHLGTATKALTKGESTFLHLHAGYAGAAYGENWKVWIDYNQDGDFTDSDELVYQTTSPVMHDIEPTFTIPNTALTGSTGMRFIMSYYSIDGPCDDITYGQVVDVIVNIDELEYCESTGNSSYEWIEAFGIYPYDDVLLIHDSGNDGGYGDFRGFTSWSVAKGTWVNFNGTPGFSGTSFPEAWDIWIDLNKDGDFNDSGENVFTGSYTTSGTINNWFFLPSSASLGTTTMRVSMSYYTNADPCASLTYGEVEDYTIEIINPFGALQVVETEVEMARQKATALPSPPQKGDTTDERTITIETASNTNTVQNNMKVFPNPSQGLSTLTIDLETVSDIQIQVISLNGQVVKTYNLKEVQFINQTIDITNQAAGQYVVMMNTDKGASYQQKIIKID